MKRASRIAVGTARADLNLESTVEHLVSVCFGQGALNTYEEILRGADP